MSVIHLDKKNFKKEVIESRTPVIVDFWASWCMPCQMMAPVFEQLSGEYAGKLKFAKLSTEEEQEIAIENKISSIPCLVVFKGGKEVERIVGFSQKNALKGRIDKILK
jgi:thioredoxin 1